MVTLNLGLLLLTFLKDGHRHGGVLVCGLDLHMGNMGRQRDYRNSKNRNTEFLVFPDGDIGGAH